MTRLEIQEIKKYCLLLDNVILCTPFDELTEVIKHRENNKMFILFCSPKERPSINLKCDPMEAEFLREIYECVVPGHHMNKKHWNTIYLDGSIPNNEIIEMIDTSYNLTKSKHKK